MELAERIIAAYDGTPTRSMQQGQLLALAKRVQELEAQQNTVDKVSDTSEEPKEEESSGWRKKAKKSKKNVDDDV